MRNTVLEVKSISKQIAGSDILKNISFEIEEGEIFGLIGPNGAGKTTLIRVICGLMKKNAGQIRIMNHEVGTSFVDAIKHVGAIIENPAFYDYLTGWQNLELYANLYSNISSDRIEEVVELVNLTERIDDKVHTYSLGMKQRLGVAQAILHKPKILILDEPTNGLDPEGMRDLRNHLLYLAKEENISILISTHLLSEVEMLCDRIGIIKAGELLEITNVKMDHHVLIIEVDDIQHALAVLDANYEVISYKGNLIRLSVEKKDIPMLNEMLVLNKVSVYQLAYDQNQLEDTFLQTISAREVGIS
ncbi:ABC transporter ATP-binding protein [Pradoshia sp. D12]|uniref:ABC transporter ATP-binding protein n=1 Tax=Bacillaceae TaxID=186817 RepID=UPI00080ACB53|nr:MULTISPECIES: ABC transporter ATP-binding protein [Bacillaceae]OCA86624.1 hypothetical protein A8L44_04845 [Bacillus sp. FJAT-27986]QFK71601.1 ABC transporter ATP-binding protein [Pradoshia sp. D12]TPF73396.1 ABC transporter ATP-binding protein [Bacillus sp. D12]